MVQAVDDIIHEAQKKLLIISPFIRLDDYFKKLFSVHQGNAEVEIILVFGKNEYDVSRSLNYEDFDFFKSFPNIGIVYVPNLHAKYFSNERRGVITSINLLDSSFRNNVEYGVVGEPKMIGGTDKFDNEAWQTSIDVVSKGLAVFARVPKYKKKMLGLAKDYVGSETKWDVTEQLLNGYSFEEHNIFDFLDEDKFVSADLKKKPKREEFSAEPQIKGIGEENQLPEHGFCIRCSKEIDYDPNRPFCYECYSIWAQWGNAEYLEDHCHCCGKTEHTSKAKPLCYECFTSN